MRTLRGPVWPPLQKGPVVIPGHRPSPHTGAYRAGISRYRCTCGSETVPAPPATAAALWREHLEINMAKNTDPDKFSGEPLANAGRSILEIVWERLDATYAELMEGAGKKTAGKAAGLAEAVAIMTNPYEMDVDAIKAQAHARWESSGVDEEDTEPEED